MLVVDQFEELFTACQDEQERREFVDALVRAAGDPERGSVVVLAVRADFYGRCATYPELARLLGANHVLVGAMSRDELRRAIERPAQRVGLRVEPELADALLADVDGQPGALPLLSTALLELWRQRDGRRLRLQAYTRSGGVHGAVARLAEEAFLALDADPAARWRATCCCASPARARAARSCAAGSRSSSWRPRAGGAHADVVALLTDRRLLTISDGAVEVAHEALLREWPRLRGWLEEDGQGRRLHRQISDAAQAWHADARDSGGLYRGARLAGALEWRAAHEDQLNATEREFLDAGRAAAERAQRRLRVVLGGVSLLLVAAVIAGFVALDQRGNARPRPGSRRHSGSAPRRSPSTRWTARCCSPGRRSRSTTRRPRRATCSPRCCAARPRSACCAATAAGCSRSPSPRTAGRSWPATTAGNVLAFDATTWRRQASYRTGGPVRTLAFSPDGTRLAIASGIERDGRLDLLDAASFRRIAHHRIGTRAAAVPTRSRSRPTPASWCRATRAGTRSGSARSRGCSRAGMRAPAAREGANARDGQGQELLVAFAGARRLLDVGDDERATIVRDARTLRPIRRLPAWGELSATAVSHDGRVAALARDDGSLRLLDLRTGRSRTLAGRQDAPCRARPSAPTAPPWSRGDDAARVTVWDVAGASPVRPSRATRAASMACRSRPTAPPPTAPASTAP